MTADRQMVPGHNTGQPPQERILNAALPSAARLLRRWIMRPKAAVEAVAGGQRDELHSSIIGATPESSLPHGVMCSTIADLRYWRQQEDPDGPSRGTATLSDTSSGGGGSGELLTELPGDVTTALQVLELSLQSPLTATVDHFYHSELYSRAAVRAGSRLSVVVQVDLFGTGPGSRPGYDTQRLAAAAARLPGIEMVGLYANLSGLENRSADQQSLHDALHVLQHTQRLLQRERVRCSRMIVLTSRHPASIPGQAGVTEVCWPSTRDQTCVWRPGGHATVDNASTARTAAVPQSDSLPAVSHSRQAGADQAASDQAASDQAASDQAASDQAASDQAASDQAEGRSPQILTAQVVSRPALQYAVIRCGWRDWCQAGAPAQSTPEAWPTEIPRVTSVEGAAIAEIGPDTTVLMLAGAALDLTIGERVQMSVEC